MKITTICKIIILLLTFMVTAALTGCKNAPEPVTAGGEAHGVPASETDEPDEAVPGENAGGERGNIETGVVVYSDGAMLMICTPDGRNLNFLVEGGEVDKSGARGLAAGSEVDVYYIGVVNGSDTSAAQVVKLEQSGEQEKPGTGVGVAGGIVLEADASSLKIAAFNGEELAFTIEDGAAGKLAAGGYVTVFYEGEITGGGAEGVRVVKVVGK